MTPTPADWSGGTAPSLVAAVSLPEGVVNRRFAPWCPGARATVAGFVGAR